MVSKLLLVLSLFLFSSSMSMARPLTDQGKLEEEGTTTSSCWNSLLELQSCMGEVVLFFLNGETFLGPNCCQAIRTIENHCWPAMLGSVGIDTQEGDILLGYCDAATNSGSTPPPLPPSSPVPVDHSSVNVTTTHPRVAVNFTS